MTVTEITYVISLYTNPITMLAVMILNEQDKEALVIDLLNQGHPARQIAKQAHISFTDITKMKRKVNGEYVGDNIEKSKSLTTIFIFQPTTFIPIVMHIDKNFKQNYGKGIIWTLAS